MLKFKKCRNGFAINRMVKDNITPQPVVRYFKDIQTIRVFIGCGTYDFKIPLLPTAYLN